MLEGEDMKGFLISDNHDTMVGMKLAGIDGVVMHDREAINNKLKELTRNSEIGIIIVTEKITNIVRDEIIEYKNKVTIPLIVEIPDRHDSNRGNNTIMNYVRESLGIKV